MSAAFTPGPWKARPIIHEETTQFVTKGEPNGEWDIVCEDGEKIASEDPWFVAMAFDGAPGSTEANATLIAAAPELYEALDELMSVPVGESETAACIKANAALAKARGEPA